MRFVALLAVLLVPGVARARCVVPCDCYGMSPWVVSGVGEAVALDGGRSSVGLRVQRVFGPTDAGGPEIGSLIEGGGAVGSESVFGTGWSGFAEVVDGGVRCGTVRFTLEEYAAILQTGTCQSSLAERGYVQPPCNDTSSCASTGPQVGVLALLAIALRRRASRA